MLCRPAFDSMPAPVAASLVSRHILSGLRSSESHSARLPPIRSRPVATRSENRFVGGAPGAHARWTSPGEGGWRPACKLIRCAWAEPSAKPVFGGALELSSSACKLRIAGGGGGGCGVCRRSPNGALQACCCRSDASAVVPVATCAAAPATAPPSLRARASQAGLCGHASGSKWLRGCSWLADCWQGTRTRVAVQLPLWRSGEPACVGRACVGGGADWRHCKGDDVTMGHAVALNQVFTPKQVRPKPLSFVALDSIQHRTDVLIDRSRLPGIRMEARILP